jgi:ABC-2 type transport system permease protein
VVDYTTAARLAWTEHVAAVPPRISMTAAWPRAVLQCLFWVLVGRVSGTGAAYAFPGAVALSVTLSTVIGLSDVPMLDQRSGTYHRVRMAHVSIAGLYAARSVPWLADAVAVYLLCVVVVGPVSGLGAMTPTLLEACPLYLLMILTSAAAGLAVASLGTRFNSNVLLGNTLTYLMLAAGSLVTATTRVPVLGTVGAGLPMTHGVAAVRAFAAGRPWWPDTVREAAVGAVWAVLAALAYRVQAARARRTGRDFPI